MSWSKTLLASLLAVRSAASVESSAHSRDPQGVGATGTDVECDVFMWPDAAEACGECRARVAGLARYGNCTGYCASLGLECRGAWAAGQDACDAAEALPCGSGARTPGSSGGLAPAPGGICECKPPGGETMFDRCGTHRWPDVREKCGPCMVQISGPVLRSKYAGSCEKYCSRLDGQVYGGQRWLCADTFAGTCAAYPAAQRDSHECVDSIEGSKDAVCWCIYSNI